MYDSPHQFEPTSLSDRQLEEIQALAENIVHSSIKLTSAAHETTRAALRELVRQMNSFYSNRIEGQSTHPRNGRATRLQSHCALWKLSEGLWSPSRGFARSTSAYYTALHNADSPRRGDLDGRGNLSAAGLLEWVMYFLEICEDQVSYMSRMLALDGIKQRIEALIIFRSTHDKAIRREAILPLVHVFGLGPVARGDFRTRV